MSESVTTIIKVLSSLTSPKASVKYISVGIFMLLTWKYISKIVDITGISSEQKSVVVLFIGLGLGSLIGHLMYLGFDYCYSKHKKSKEKKAKLKIEESESKKTLDEFKKVYLHYDHWTKKILRDLSNKELCIEWERYGLDAPKENGYIQKVLNVDSSKDIYKLHPALTSFVSNEWSDEVKANMGQLFDDFSENKKSLVKLLEFKNRGQEGPLAVDAIDVARNHQYIFNIEVEDEDGFYITLEQPYHDLICEKLNVELADETYILKSRIILMENVA
ncbi:hypothetical protein HQQ94_07170 [Shewanella sp. VB17]|uniref:hypothetical protein n=1 Tax=Shewanella sp. VB17 TaxID=2739432 RepID=UPI0015673BE9|nr:hypothetical protein [Shewanella sp. VB17]NRD73023.1 hypothetical protein [Shewanella sp. VB17]